MGDVLKCIDCAADLSEGAIYCNVCGAQQGLATRLSESGTLADSDSNSAYSLQAAEARTCDSALGTEQRQAAPLKPSEAIPSSSLEIGKVRARPKKLAVTTFLGGCLIGSIGFWASTQQWETTLFSAEPSQAQPTRERRQYEQVAQQRLDKLIEQAEQSEREGHTKGNAQAAERRPVIESQFTSSAWLAATAKPTADAEALLTRADRCATVTDCVEVMLEAARLRRPEPVQVAATRIDEFAKPARGNRNLARELNRRALDDFRAADFPSSIQLLNQAAEADPRDVEIQSNLGLANARAGHLQPAVNALLGAISLDPRRTSAWVPMGEALDLAGRSELAEAALLLAFEFSAAKEKCIDYFREQATTAKRDTLKLAYARALRTVESGS